MKVSKMPGFGSMGTIVDGFDWEDPNDYHLLKDININSLVTVIRGNGTDQFSHLVKNFRHLVTTRSIGIRFAARYGLDWHNQVTEEDKQAIEYTSNWALGPVGPQWTRVTGKKDNNGRSLGGFGDTELLWHSNEYASYEFCPVVALYGAENMNTSATCFLQTVDWYEKQTESFRSELDQLIAVGEWNNELLQPGSSIEDHITMKVAFVPEGTFRTPLVVVSPGGRKGLHWSPWITGFEGMTQHDGDQLIEKIKSEIFVEEYQYDYWWDHSKGDMVLFDNTVTMHMRKIKENLNLKLELQKRLGYRNVGEYAGHELYNPFLHEEFKEKRDHLMNLVQKLRPVNWTYHLDDLKKLRDPVEQEKYILKNIHTAAQDYIRQALKN
jgi:hypothetical protein